MTLKLFYAKSGSKKRLIFEKWEDFENWQKRPPCKGYSLCKIISLGQKIKLLTTCKKELYNHAKVLLCKKQLIFEKWEDFENWQKWPLCKGYSLCKIISSTQKIIMLTTCKKELYNHIKVLLCKRPFEKTANIREMWGFWKLAKTATTQRL